MSTMPILYMMANQKQKHGLYFLSLTINAQPSEIQQQQQQKRNVSRNDRKT